MTLSKTTINYALKRGLEITVWTGDNDAPISYAVWTVDNDDEPIWFIQADNFKNEKEFRTILNMIKGVTQ